MKLVALPAFTDNYVWLMHDGCDALVVDPGDAAPVHSALREQGLHLRTILVTHHHADHTAGVQSLIDAHGPKVYGPARETLPHSFIPVGEGERLHVLGTDFTVMEVPGHTAGHVAYFGQPTGQPPLLFCGDTLFSAGCGRLFEGTAAQMHASLCRLAGLPAQTRVCCTHEYTVANLRFALAADPENQAAQQHLQACLALRERGEPTLPSHVGLELQINPFLRCGTEPIRRAALMHEGAPVDQALDEVAVFGALRNWKNRFR